MGPMSSCCMVCNVGPICGPHVVVLYGVDEAARQWAAAPPAASGAAAPAAKGRTRAGATTRRPRGYAMATPGPKVLEGSFASQSGMPRATL